MVRMTRCATIVVAVCALCVYASTATTAQTRGAIIGTGTFTAFVENMDRSSAFYHDVFGMDVPPLQSGISRRACPARGSASS